MIAQIAEAAGSAYGDLYALTWPQIQLRWDAHTRLSDQRREAGQPAPPRSR